MIQSSILARAHDAQAAVLAQDIAAFIPTGRRADAQPTARAASPVSPSERDADEAAKLAAEIAAFAKAGA